MQGLRAVESLAVLDYAPVYAVMFMHVQAEAAPQGLHTAARKFPEMWREGKMWSTSALQGTSPTNCKNIPKT
jgi:hypothetical protein